MHRLHDSTDPSADPKAARRRRYQRPAVLERQQLEAMAADCNRPGGKGDPTCLIPFS